MRPSPFRAREHLLLQLLTPALHPGARGWLTQITAEMVELRNKVSA
jgi:hypothetical protein